MSFSLQSTIICVWYATRVFPVKQVSGVSPWHNLCFLDGTMRATYFRYVPDSLRKTKMHRIWFPVLALLASCSEASSEAAADHTPTSRPLASSAPVTAPAPAPLTPLAAPRIAAAADVRLPKKSTKKDPRTDIRVQIFFPNDVPRPLAGESVDMLGPDGYRFTAKVSYLKEEIRFAEDGKPFAVSGVGYYAMIQPTSFPDGVEISPKGELLIAAIPSVEARKTRAKAVPNPPEDAQRPEALRGAKLTSYADADGDGEVDIISGTLTKGTCRLVFVKENKEWKERRNVCGPFPQQIRISTAPPEPENPDSLPVTPTDPKKPVDPKKPTQ
jgi:hypothetical protein